MKFDLYHPSQSETLIDLLCELNAYYHPTHPAPRDTVAQHALTHLVSASSPHVVLLASTDQNQAIGLAALTVVYSWAEPDPDKYKQLQLKELFISAAHRQQGVGHQLMRRVCQYALEHGCHRIDWPVKALNRPGQAFYQSIGAYEVEDRLSYRLSEPQLTLLTQQPPLFGH